MFAAFKNSKRCYIDVNGNILLETDYTERFVDFNDERAGVLVNKKWGFIDTKGNLAIEPKYENIQKFKEGLCAVKLSGKWGFVDTKGELIIQPEYYDVGNFSDGLAGVQAESFGEVKYINPRGKTIIENSGLYVIYDYSEGVLACKDKESVAYGYRNIKGDWVIDPQYAIAENFSETLAGVSIEEKKTAKTLFINKKNNQVLPAKYETVHPCFKDDRAVVMKKIKGDYLSGCINKKGELVIPIEFYIINDFSDDLAAAKVKEKGKWGFINKKGEFQITPRFNSIYYHFRDGLALVYSEKDNLMYINKKGDVVFEFS